MKFRGDMSPVFGNRELEVKLLDFESYRTQLARFEFDRVTLFGGFSYADDNEPSGVMPRIMPIVQRLFTAEPKNDGVCCRRGVRIPRVAQPCCSTEALYYCETGLCKLPGVDDFICLSAYNHSVHSQAREKTDKSLSWLVKNLLDRKLAHITLEYLGKRMTIMLLAPLWRVDCPRHAPYAGNAMSLYGADDGFANNLRLKNFLCYDGAPVLRLPWINPVWRVALLSSELNNFVFAHEEEMAILTAAQHSFGQQLAKAFDDVRHITASLLSDSLNMRDWSDCGKYKNGLHLMQHRKTHSQYFSSWKFIRAVCESPGVVAADLLLECTLTHRFKRLTARLRRARVVELIRDAVVCASSLYTMDGHSWVLRERTSRDKSFTQTNMIQDLYGFFPAVHSQKERVSVYCDGCLGTILEWSEMTAWVEMNRLTPDWAEERDQEWQTEARDEWLLRLQAEAERNDESTETEFENEVLAQDPDEVMELTCEEFITQRDERRHELLADAATKESNPPRELYDSPIEIKSSPTVAWTTSYNLSNVQDDQAYWERMNSNVPETDEDEMPVLELPPPAFSRMQDEIDANVAATTANSLSMSSFLSRMDNLA